MRCLDCDEINCVCYECEECKDLKAEVKKLQQVVDEIAWITEPYKFEGEMEFATDFQVIKTMAWEHRSEDWHRRESDE